MEITPEIMERTAKDLIYAATHTPPQLRCVASAMSGEHPKVKDVLDKIEGLPQDHPLKRDLGTIREGYASLYDKWKVYKPEEVTIGQLCSYLYPF